MKVYSDSEITNILAIKLPNWQYIDDCIERQLEFKNFDEAFDFMTKAAEKCKEQNHHPQWTNVYKKLTVKLQTHDEDGITEKDISLALAFDSLLSD